MKPFPTILVCLFFGTLLSGQQLLDVRLNNSCSYYGENLTDEVYGFASSTEAQEIVNRIVDVVGLKPNFEIKAGNVPNALATTQDGKRLIIYSQDFILKINNSTGNDWAGISILAHEIGHHLNGHTIEGGGSRPTLELESDEFSGFILGKLGAGLAEAQSAIAVKGSDRGSTTHPPKSARLEAIAVGWNKASGGKKPAVPEKPDPEKEREKTLKREPEPIDDEATELRGTAEITIAYAGDLYGCSLPVSINIGNKTFTPVGNSFRISGIPRGSQKYTVSGTINCPTIGSCQAYGEGTIDIVPNRIYYVVWQNTAYAQCSIWLSTQ